MVEILGAREPLNDTIRLVAYDPGWPALFAGLAAGIRRALGARVLMLEHVGSTSVPGLSAKPIVDVLLAVEDSSDEPAYVPALEAAGWVLRAREPEWFEHRLLRPADASANLHVFPAGCEEIGRMLLFRDRLRASPEERRLYEDAKRELAGRVWAEVQDYADAKTDVVRAILSRAQAGRSAP